MFHCKAIQNLKAVTWVKEKLEINPILQKDTPNERGTHCTGNNELCTHALWAPLDHTFGHCTTLFYSFAQEGGIMLLKNGKLNTFLRSCWSFVDSEPYVSSKSVAHKKRYTYLLLLCESGGIGG